MNKFYLGSAAAIALSATSAYAGGIERSVFSPGFLYAEGNVAELSFGAVDPSVSGSVGGGAVKSGDMASAYTSLSGSIKTQISDKLAFGLLVDQPVGADVNYPASAASYPFAGSNATITSAAVTGLLKYNFNPNVSVYGGLRAEKATGEAVVTIGAGTYTLNKVADTGFGYIVGAAYEKPEIALRVSLTYVSAIDHDFSGTDYIGPVNFTTTVPQSVSLDFQSGIAPDTLAFGSIRWRDWSEFTILTGSVDPRGALSSGSNDTVTYTLGVGRKFNERFSGALSAGYETTTPGTAGNLAPTNGSKSLTLAGVYTTDTGTKITAGVSYGWLGNATTGTIAGSFTGSHYIGAGVKVAWKF